MDVSYYSNYGSSQSSAAGMLGILSGVSLAMLIIPLAISILLLVSMWKIYTKAGKPGWASIVPFYNAYVMCEIAGKEGWYMLLYLIPVVNIYVSFVINDGLAKRFGKSTGFAIGLMFLPIIFFPILAFSSGDVTTRMPDGVEVSQSSVNTMAQTNSNMQTNNLNETPNFNEVSNNTGFVNQNGTQTNSFSGVNNQVNAASMNETPSFNEVPNNTGFANQNGTQMNNFNGVNNQVNPVNTNEVQGFNGVQNNTGIPNQNDINQNNG